jgi:hypothetical protein
LQPLAGENNYKWNGIHFHHFTADHERLYFGSERLFRSDDREQGLPCADLSRRSIAANLGDGARLERMPLPECFYLYGSMVAL